ncbi:NDR1/HIN1-like protein 12 [Chenopodium quinoa]|uniref:NDR1/HIN1-like protein 12 n=1 Tax=Chenopodium quinoa TaxID=63459 RepID=UPI000B78DCAC|nr:NDR1/HIN1-like protein 12 [Chenopodium quinoa]
MPYYRHGHVHHHHQRRTHPLIWCAAIICTFCTIIVIILGIVVFVGYLALRPSIPFVKVTYAHLDKFEYSQAGVLNTEMNIIFQAENDNTGARASFSDFTYYLSFHGIQIARLKNLPFNVDKNDSAIFNYDVKSYSIPLDPQHSAIVDRSLKQNRISFELMGDTRTRWRVGPIKSVKFWLRLSCELKFQGDGSYTTDSHCTSKSK